MSVIREHLKRRVLEVTSSKYSAGLSRLRLEKDRKVTLKLPLASWKDSIPRDKVSSVLQMNTDQAFSSVSYSEDDDSLVFALNERNLISETLSEAKDSQRCVSVKPQKLVVDFSSPNIAKPFHMGHLRSTIVGQFVANVLGVHHDVTRLNYLGDWGTQFGFVQKGLELLQVSDDDFRADPIGVLYKAYVTSYNTPGMIDEARNIFLKLETGEDAFMNEWEKIKTVTLENLRKTYESLGIRFDVFSFESDYRASKIQPVIQDLLDKNLARVDEQLIADVNETKVPLLRQNNTTLYITRDIAAALDRIQKFRCDKIFYVVDKSQSQHFRNLDSILGQLGHQGVVQFCPFGRITGMSTRKGTSVFLSDILEESVSKMAEQQKSSKNTRATDEDTTRILGLTGLHLYILKHGRLRDFSFDWNQALQATGDSGVKVQYTHSRLCSLEERFGFDPCSLQDFDCRSLDDPTILPLVVEMARVDEVIRDAVEGLESSHVVSHLFKLCNLTSRALKNVQVKGQEPAVAQHRLLLFHRARSKIKMCMELLGLKPLNKM